MRGFSLHAPHFGLVLLLALAGCEGARGQTAAPEAPQASAGGVAVFAAGCFWCVEEAFEKVSASRR